MCGNTVRKLLHLCFASVLFLAIGVLFRHAILTHLTLLRWMAKKVQSTKKNNWWVQIGLRIGQHLSGSFAVYTQWLVGYFVWSVWKQAQWQLSTNVPEEWQSFCALGNTIFTPTYPIGTERPSEIFAASPLSTFGFAVLTFSVFVTWLSFSKAELERRECDAKALVELLALDNFKKDSKWQQHRTLVGNRVKETAQTCLTMLAQVEAFSVVVALAGENVLKLLMRKTCLSHELSFSGL